MKRNTPVVDAKDAPCGVASTADQHTRRVSHDPGVADADRRPPLRIAVVIPCYNTSSACRDVIARALAVTDAVLPIDDGSTDDTAQHLTASGARFLRLSPNSGKGAALRRGIEEVLKGPAGILRDTFDYIVTMDGDGQHNADDIPRLIAGAQRDDADLVIGTRDVRLMPPKSKFGNYVSRMLFYLGTGAYVLDTQSGFRVLSMPLAETLVATVRWRRYESEAEVLSKSVMLGYRVRSIPIPTIYFDQNRRTHFDPLRDSLRVFAVLSRYVLASFALTALDIGAFVLFLATVTPDLVGANVLARMVSVGAHLLVRRTSPLRARRRLGTIQPLRQSLSVLANLGLTTGLLVLLAPRMPGPLAAKITAHAIGFVVGFVVVDVFHRAHAGWRTRAARAPMPDEPRIAKPAASTRPPIA